METKVGDLIRQSRINYGYKTQKEFADVSSISPATLSRIEKNIQKPTPETLMHIAKHLRNVTYGELMKVAGYLDGLEEDHEKYLTHFMNENEQLDKKAFTLIDRLIQIQQFDEEIQNDIVHAFKTINLDVLETSKEQLEAVYVRNDLELEKKQKLIEALESVQKKYSPKLGTYISQSKNVIPIPLIRSLYDGKGLIANEAIEEYIHYPFLSRKQPDFALRIKDNSMSKAGIEIDDIVFLRKTKWAEYNGQIVGVIINGQDGMLKRMKWTEGSPKIQLVSGNDSINPLEVFPNEIIMCGVYDGHFKMDKMR